MANKRFWFGVSVIALVFVMTVLAAGCTLLDDILNPNDDDTPGSSGGSGSILTMTDIPSEYNGKYALFMVEEESAAIIGAESIDWDQEAITLVKISGGKASLPLWIMNSNGDGFDKFTGDYTAGEYRSGVLIFETKTIYGNMDMSKDPIAVITFGTIEFKKGSAAKSWNEDDVWSKVTSFSQIDGAWRAPSSVSGKMQYYDLYYTIVYDNYIVTFDAANHTMSATGSGTTTYSGVDVDLFWPQIKSNAESMNEEDGITVDTNDADHSVTVTYNNYSQEIPEEEELGDSGMQINLSRTKLMMSSGGIVYIYTKVK